MNLGFGQLFILICLAGLLFADLPSVITRLKSAIQNIQNERKRKKITGKNKDKPAGDDK